MNNDERKQKADLLQDIANKAQKVGVLADYCAGLVRKGKQDEMDVPRLVDALNDLMIVMERLHAQTKEAV